MSDYTKIDIAMALDDLLEKKLLKDITVSDITKRAGVNRQTFYYHFKNIYALLAWSVDKDVENYLSYCKENNLSWFESLLFLSEKIKQSRSLILNAYQCVSSKTFRAYLNKLSFPVVSILLDEKIGDKKISKEDQDNIISFFTCLFTGYFLSWVDCDEKHSKEGIEALVKNVEISLEAILKTL